MRILITGIHGFVGTNLVKAFKGHHRIYGLDILAPYTEGVEHTYSWQDLDAGAVPEVDTMIHLAGKAHDTKDESDADEYFEVNTGLTRRIYDYFLISGAGKFIFFSSVKAAAEIVRCGALDENVVPDPKGPYGESKILAEDYIRAHWDAPRKKTYIFRPCMIHGPGNKGNLNQLYSVILRRVPWPLGAFDNKRSFTSIENLIFIIRRMLEVDAGTGVYNIADDTPLSTNRLITLICEALGQKPRIWNIPCGIIRAVARCGTVLHLPLDSGCLRKLTENYVVENAKIKAAIGVERLPVSAEEGILYTIKSFADSFDGK